ncbi:MAG: hypothetical protein ABSF03_10425 [Streptosporangiaceae bacterium]
MSAPEPAREELLTALEAVREAIDIPHAATVGDAETRAKILDERLISTVIMLRNILGKDGRAVDVPWSVECLRARLAEHPAEGYKTWHERVAELERDRQAGGRGDAR